MESLKSSESMNVLCATFANEGRTAKSSVDSFAQKKGYVIQIRQLLTVVFHKNIFFQVPLIRNGEFHLNNTQKIFYSKRFCFGWILDSHKESIIHCQWLFCPPTPEKKEFSVSRKKKSSYVRFHRFMWNEFSSEL